MNFPHEKLTVNYKSSPCIINEKKIPQMDYDDMYLGIHIDPRGNLSGTTIEQTRQKLEIITKSPLKAQQKTEILREIISMQIAYQLEFTNASDATVNKLDLLFREYTKKWLRIHGKCPNILIHGREKCGGLGIPNLKDTILKRKYNRFDRMNSVEDDHIEAIRKIMKEPTGEMTDIIEKLENTTDCRALKNHWMGEQYYKSRWMKGNHYTQIIRTRLGVLQTPSRIGREKKDYSLRACPLCNIPCANLNHIISECHIDKAPPTQS